MRVASPGTYSLEGALDSALELSIGIFDPHVFFEQATEFERAKVDVPDTVIDLLEPHVLPGAHDADVDPIPLPTDAPGVPPVPWTVYGLGFKPCIAVVAGSVLDISSSRS